MNDRYKFRGKRIDNGEWVYGSLINTPTATNSFKTTIVDEKANLWYTLPNGELHINKDAWNLVIPETVGQYTGLKDKNGKEIYEGDVVKRTIYPLNQYSYDEYYQIKELNYYIYKGEKYGHFNVSLWSTDCEVIGNIHDNPELLEVV